MKSLQVYVIALPNGETLWTKGSPTIEKVIGDVMKNWRDSTPSEKLDAYEKAGCTTGVVMIYMLEEEYLKISATNRTARLFKNVELPDE